MKWSFETTDKIERTFAGFDGFKAKLTDPYDFTLNGVDCRIPTGFTFDWASVPQAFWNIFPPLGRHSWAALVHDWLYRHHTFDGNSCTKDFADKAFLFIMKKFGVGFVRRRIMYCAVKFFGRSAWNAGSRRKEAQGDHNND